MAFTGRVCSRRVFRRSLSIVGTLMTDYAEGSAGPCATLLSHRSLVRVNGSDTRNFLQGILTADITSDVVAQYCMMLNPQGRVLYDALLFKEGDESLLLECDSNAVTDVVKHLKRYALRSEVQISHIPSEYQLWVVRHGDGLQANQRGVMCVADPRTRELGARMLISEQPGDADVLRNVSKCPEGDYHSHRLELGIAEGVEEIPPGSCFPLEYNLDYLNGVSFTKGCYLGQELTARTHHTGVVRKRVLPLTFSTSIDGNSALQPGATIHTNSGKKAAGKMICYHQRRGLALMRLQYIGEGHQLSVCISEDSYCQVSAKFPPWWPLQT